MIKLLTEEDKAAVQAYLERHVFETAPLAGNIRRYGLENTQISRRSGDYYGFFTGSQLQGVAAFYNLGSVMPHFETPAAVPAFAEIMSARRFGVMAGMKSVVVPLAQALPRHKTVQAYEDSYYLINKGLEPLAGQNSFRIVNAADIDRPLALDFVVEAYRQGFKRRFNRELAAKLIDDRSVEEDFVFLLVEGVPKAQAMIQSATSQVTQIAGVYTDEHSRGKGYCKKVVAELCRRSGMYGKTPTLLVRQDNVPAVKAYRDIGFTYYGDYLIIKYAV